MRYFIKSEQKHELQINASVDNLMSTVNEKNKKGQTALHRAVIKDNYSMVEDLAKNPQTLKDVPNDQGNTPLHLACQKNPINSVAFVNVLVEAGHSVEVQNSLGDTPLHTAASLGNIPLVRLLLSKSGKADFVNIQNLRGETAMHLAVLTGKHEIVQLLLDKKAKVDKITHPINTPIKLGCYDTSESASQSGSSLPLHYALSCKKLSPEIIDSLLKNTFSSDKPNQQGYSCLHLALKHPDVNSLSENTMTSLIYASDLALTTKDQKTCLHIMAENEYVDAYLLSRVISKDVTRKINVNALDKNKQTALFSACSNKRTLFALGLLSNKKDDINVNLGNGHTFPLHVAIKNNLTLLSLEIIQYIPSNMLSQIDATGCSPLVYAAENANTQVLEKLRNSRVIFSDSQGQLAIKKATLNKHIDTVIQLIAYDANPNVHIYPSKNDNSFGSCSSKVSVSVNDGKDKTGHLQPGDSPLHLAVKLELIELATSCLQAQPEMVNSANDNSKMPTHIAIKVLSSTMAHLLKTYGDKLEPAQEVKNTTSGFFNEKRKTTLLMQAASRGFQSEKELKDFFENPEYKLTEVQEVAKAKALQKYKIAPQQMFSHKFEEPVVTGSTNNTNAAVI